jgi:protein-tyrosine-phosphatase
MAEGFARTYGSDVMRVASAGLAPAASIPPLTRQVMLEKNVALDAHFPKGLDLLVNQSFDLVVNMSGATLPPIFGAVEMLQWLVPDPIGGNEGYYRQVRDQIENLVMQLVLQLRQRTVAGPGRRIKFRGTGPAR